MIGIAGTSGGDPRLSAPAYLNYDESSVIVSSSPDPTDLSGEIASGSVIPLTESYTIYYVFAANPNSTVAVDGNVQVSASPEFGCGFSCSINAEFDPLHMNVTSETNDNIRNHIDINSAGVSIGQYVSVQVVRTNTSGQDTPVNNKIYWSLPGSTLVKGVDNSPQSTAGDYVFGYSQENSNFDQVVPVPSEFKVTTSQGYTAIWGKTTLTSTGSMLAIPRLRLKSSTR